MIENSKIKQSAIPAVKKESGAAKGLLKNIVINSEVTEQESLEQAIDSYNELTEEHGLFSNSHIEF